MGLKRILSKAAPIIGGAIGFVVGGPAGAAAGFGIGGVAGGTIAGMEAESADRKTAAQQQRLARLQAQRQRKELIRDVQFAQAAATAANIAAGAGLGSSTIQGQIASQRSTLRDDLGFHAVGGDVSNAIWRFSKQADSWRSAGNMASALGQIGSSLAGTFAQSGEFVNLPKHGTVPQGGVPVPHNYPPPGGYST